MDWRIYYEDQVVTGSSKEAWIKAPDGGVQVVTVMEEPSFPYPDRRITGYVHCLKEGRMLYTGVDEYDPLGYGHVKTGLLVDDSKYWIAWERAYGNG